MFQPLKKACGRMLQPRNPRIWLHDLIHSQKTQRQSSEEPDTHGRIGEDMGVSLQLFACDITVPGPVCSPTSYRDGVSPSSQSTTRRLTFLDNSGWEKYLFAVYTYYSLACFLNHLWFFNMTFLNDYHCRQVSGQHRRLRKLLEFEY